MAFLGWPATLSKLSAMDKMEDEDKENTSISGMVLHETALLGSPINLVGTKCGG